jgi:hypothetical protein
MASKSHARRQRRPIAHITARIRLQLARQKLSDIRQFRTGDDGRFTRMVDGRGKQLGDPATWIAHIRTVLADADVRRFQPGAVRRLEREMQRLGYGVAAAADD